MCQWTFISLRDGRTGGIMLVHHKKDRRRKYRHFAAELYYADGRAFVRVYTDREKADAFAARQSKSPVVKTVRVIEVD
jgi:uncharacterized protein YlbG (UPF0298 family)